jgi:predicted nuclease with TOPRIM domain
VFGSHVSATIEGFEKQITNLRAKYDEGKDRGKKLETENKELKEENKKINNELKELKKVIIWLNMKISGNTSTTERVTILYIDWVMA